MALNTSLSVYWKCDETSGNLTAITGGITLTAAGGPGTASGVISTARSLNGSSQYFWCTDNATVSGGALDFSYQIWVYLTSKGSNRVVLAKGDVGSSNLEYQLQYNASSDRWEWIVSSNGTATTTIVATSAGSPPTNQWTCLHVWHQHNNHIGICVNGRYTNTTGYSGGVFNGTGNFSVGFNVTGSYGYVAGRVDEIALWRNRVLNANERRALANDARGRTYDSLGNTGYAVWAADSLALSSGADVATWDDTGTLGNAGRDPGSSAPTYWANVVNGKPVVRFASGKALRLDLLMTDDAFTCYAVTNRSGTERVVALGGLARGYWDTYTFFGTSGDAEFLLRNDNDSGVTLSTTNSGWNVWTARVSGSTGEVFKNGTSIGSAGYSGDRTFANLGRRDGQDSGGDIAEVRFYPTAHDATTRQAIEQELGTKYGISPPGLPTFASVGACTVKGATCAATATRTVPTFSGAAAATVKGATAAAAATFRARHTGAAAVVAPRATAAAASTFVKPTKTAAVVVTAKAATAAATATRTKPTYTATVVATLKAATVAVTATVTKPTYAGAIVATAKAPTTVAGAQFKPAGPAWSFVQSAQASGTTGTAPTVAFSTNVVAGDWLILCANTSATSGTFGVTDTRASVWQRAGSNVVNGLANANLWYAVAPSSGPCTITYSQSVGGSYTLIALAYRGVATYFASASGTGTSTAIATAACSVGAAYSLLVGTWGNRAGSTVTSAIQPGFIQRETQPLGVPRNAAHAGDGRVSVNTAVTFTAGASVQWSAVAASFTPQGPPATAAGVCVVKGATAQATATTTKPTYCGAVPARAPRATAQAPATRALAGVAGDATATAPRATAQVSATATLPAGAAAAGVTAPPVRAQAAGTTTPPITTGVVQATAPSATAQASATAAVPQTGAVGMATVAHAVLVGAATLTPPTVGAAAVVAPAARVNAFGDVAPPYLGEPVGPGWVVRTRWVTGNVAKTTVVGGAVARAKFVADRSRGSFLG